MKRDEPTFVERARRFRSARDETIGNEGRFTQIAALEIDYDEICHRRQEAGIARDRFTQLRCRIVETAQIRVSDREIVPGGRSFRLAWSQRNNPFEFCRRGGPVTAPL